MAGATSRLSGARALEPAGRSRRHLRAADRDALSAEVAVQQHIAAEKVHAHGRRQRLVNAIDRRQREARSSRAENDGSDHDVQPVETAGGHKARYRIGAAFDQKAAEAADRERRDDRGGGKLALVPVNGNTLDPDGELSSRVRAGDHEPADTVVRQHPGTRWYSATGIDDDPRRARALDAAD